MANVQQDQPPKMTLDCGRVNSQGTLQISTSRKGLLRDENSKRGGFTLFISRFRFFKFNSATFRQIVQRRDEASCNTPSSTRQGLRTHLFLVLSDRLDRKFLLKVCSEYINEPFNVALLLWISCVTISGAILFLVMTGMLNGVLPKESQRNAWFEVNNQILNALFTLMCLYQHPKRLHHLVLLCRWKPKDVSALRKIYCKDGTYKPNEWTHMMVVVILLHVNCFGQYALCALNLGYRRSNRPAIGVGACLSVAIASAAVAGLYSILSPLGKEYVTDINGEVKDQNLASAFAQASNLRRKSLEKRFSFALRNKHGIIEYTPEWRGGLFDLLDNSSIAYLSLFCSFCSFGWNMERLGFGNKYVHIATFLLFCIAPFWIFGLAAMNIDNKAVRDALGFTGILLCVFGLLYGGFWRIQMRKRFNLPGTYFFCGKPAVADCAEWLFCCWCSLAQELRTADYYDIVEEKFCRKQTCEQGQVGIPHSPSIDVEAQNIYSSSPSNQRMLSLGSLLSPNGYSNNSCNVEGQPPKPVDETKTMKPPSSSSMEREGYL